MCSPSEGSVLLSESVWRKGPAPDSATRTHPWTNPRRKYQPESFRRPSSYSKTQTRSEEPTGNSGIDSVYAEGSSSGEQSGQPPSGHIRLPRVAKGMCGP